MQFKGIFPHLGKRTMTEHLSLLDIKGKYHFFCLPVAKLASEKVIYFHTFVFNKLLISTV